MQSLVQRPRLGPKTLAALVVALGLLTVACGGSDGNTLPTVEQNAAGTCLAGDPDCADDGSGNGVDADALPSAVALSDPDDPNAPLGITFGGFFYSDGNVVQLCSSLAESFPPQCGSLVIDIEASVDEALEYVAESFGNPDDAKINIEQGVYWTDDWINLTGTLQANRLVLG